LKCSSTDHIKLFLKYKAEGPVECLSGHHWKEEEGKTEMKEICCNGREEPEK
jgi:hypothetical protein